MPRRMATTHEGVADARARRDLLIHAIAPGDRGERDVREWRGAAFERCPQSRQPPRSVTRPNTRWRRRRPSDGTQTDPQSSARRADRHAEERCRWARRARRRVGSIPARASWMCAAARTCTRAGAPGRRRVFRPPSSRSRQTSRTRLRRRASAWRSAPASCARAHSRHLRRARPPLTPPERDGGVATKRKEIARASDPGMNWSRRPASASAWRSRRLEQDRPVSATARARRCAAAKLTPSHLPSACTTLHVRSTPTRCA